MPNLSKQALHAGGWQLDEEKCQGRALQKCITQEEGVTLLLKIHSGSCGNHATSRNLVSKAFRAGFYWPTAITNTDDLVQRYEGCQFFAKQIHVPAQELQTIPAS